MYVMINNRVIPFDTLQEVALSRDTLSIRGETTNEVQWLKVDRILEPLSIGDIVEFRVEVRQNDDYVYKRGKGRIVDIEKRQSVSEGFRMTFSVKIIIIRLVHPELASN